MQVVYYAPYRNGTGYGNAAVEYILAMDSVGLNVKPVLQKLVSVSAQVPNRIAELEKKSFDNPTVVIHHTLPEYFVPVAGCKNIGLFATETDNITHTGWMPYIRLMDEVWAISSNMSNCLTKSGIRQPVRVVPHTHNNDKFHENYPPFKSLSGYSDFLFYSIGEVIERKHYSALIRAFLAEFHYSEPVKLVLKVNGQEQYNKLTSIIDYTVSTLQVRNYQPQILIIEKRLTDTEMMSLHQTCSCFVQTSHGEAWSIPAMDALGMGRTPIITGWGGQTDFINNENGWLVDYHMTPASTHGNQNLYTYNEQWASVDVGHLRRCMREAYEGNHHKRAKASDAKQFGYAQIGSLIERLICPEKTASINTSIMSG